ncbi:MliC family protein [uncultured Cardiobacterium sp.]|uniref:MliC family protein n=1 Tax=uncultured Cardiobacterium sp. TaxID=417619 RepID=UPI0026231674|nr:MliC family protein [uncultured Cardiobacterium sp.]
MKKTLALLLAIAATQATARTTYHETYRVGGNQTVPAIRNQGQLTVVPPGTPIMPPNAAAARSRINVRPLNFSNGQAHISGSIRGLGIAAYHFSGNAGQTIRMVPNSKNFAMEFALFNEEMGMRFGSVHTLPYSGNYEVRIVQNHKNAAHSKKARPYNVTIYLDGGAGGASQPLPVPASYPAGAGVPVTRPAPVPVQPMPAPVPVGVRPAPVPVAAPEEGEAMPVKKSGPTAPVAAAVPVKAAPAADSAPRRLPVKANPAPAEEQAANDAAPQPRRLPVKAGGEAIDSESADAAQAKSGKNGKGKTRNYQCQNGKNLRVEYIGIDTPSPTAVVRQGKKSVRMPMDEAASEGKNLIFSSDAGMLHLVKTDGNNLAKAEVLSFDHNGKPIAFSCKPR